MNVAFFLARHFYKTPGSGKRISGTTLHIATAGVAAGLAVMIISVCVVLGFKNEIRSKVIGFGAHIEVINTQSLANPQAFPLTDGAGLARLAGTTPGVRHVQRFATATGLLKTADSFRGISLKGIAAEYDTAFIASYLVEGQMPHFSADTASNRIVVSRQQADALGLKVGDRVYAYFFDRTIKTRRFEVAAIYQTNLTQFDKALVLTDLKTVTALNGWSADQVGGLEVQVDDYDRVDDINAALAQTVKQATDSVGSTCSAFTVESLYPNIFDWLSLLDVNVWIILLLMVCVAGVTMVSGLLILILERTSTIGLLKAMGATNAMVRHTFIHLSVFIIVRGLIWGNVIGLGLVGVQTAFGIVKLDPANYYVESVPVLLNGWLILGLNAGTLLVTTLALVGPSFLISRIQPAKAIRFD